MKLFDVGMIVAASNQIERITLECETAAIIDGAGAVETALSDKVEGIIESIAEHAGQNGFSDLKHSATMALIAISGDTTNVTQLSSELSHVQSVLLKEMIEHQFLILTNDTGSYVHNEKLFGEKVAERLPSAVPDIVEAGNCFALDRHTAAVFHLMCVAEYGLRALAKDRKIVLPKGAGVDLATWEEIIRQLERVEQAIQGYPKTAAREAQFEFYHGAMMEFKRFKNKFRNRIMHAREHYDREAALSAMIHVGNFMRILASRISESQRTPTIWKGSKWTADA